MIKINPMIRIKRISDSRYIELVNFLPTILRARIYYSFVQTFFQIVATIFETMSRCGTYAQEIYFYFLEKKKVSITFQRRKLSKEETALDFSFSFVVKINRRRKEKRTQRCQLS